jgi:hypothetical protein
MNNYLQNKIFPSHKTEILGGKKIKKIDTQCDLNKIK